MRAVTRYVIGIDPGAVSGIAVVTLSPKPELVSFAKVRLDKGALPSKELLAHKSRDIAAVAIESQYVAVNISTAIRLAQTAGRWEEAALATLGIGCETGSNSPVAYLYWVKPNEWQSHMLKGFVGKRAKRKQRKDAAISVALYRWGKQLESDVADAAMIAAFQSERMAFEMRIKR